MSIPSPKTQEEKIFYNLTPKPSGKLIQLHYKEYKEHISARKCDVPLRISVQLLSQLGRSFTCDLIFQLANRALKAEVPGSDV